MTDEALMYQSTLLSSWNRIIEVRHAHRAICKFHIPHLAPLQPCSSPSDSAQTSIRAIVSFRQTLKTQCRDIYVALGIVDG